MEITIETVRMWWHKTRSDIPDDQAIGFLFDEVARLDTSRRYLIGQNALQAKELGEQAAEHDRVLGRWQKEIYTLVSNLAPDACIDGGGCDSGDPLDLTLAEISQGFSHWDNLLFETLEGVSHSYVGKSTFKAAADMIAELHAENEKLVQQVCDECDPENYGWVHNRVEGRGACTCMIEAEPFQILLKALEQLAAGKEDSFFMVEKIAKKALHAVLPLDYPEPV